MQTGGVVIAIQIIGIKIEMGKCMGTINDDGNVIFTCHPYHFFNRQNLPGNIDHVAHQDHFRFGRDILFEKTNHFIIIFSRDRYFELFHHNAFTAFALFKGVDHAPVILRGGEYFITRFDIEPVLANLQTF